MNDKFDKLDALILLAGDVLIEEELAYAREVLNPELEISKRTDRRILRYIRHTQKKPGYHPVLNAMKRAAVVVLVIGTVLFASAMSIEAVREKFWNAIVEWYEDYIAVLFVDDTAEDTMADVEFEVQEPSYLPEGVVKGEQIHKTFSCTTIYSFENKNAIRLEQYLYSNDKMKIDNVGCEISQITINSYEVLVAEYKESKQSYIMVWEDETYWYKLTSWLKILDKEDLQQIISSLYK